MEQNFPVVLSVMQCQVFLTFESEDEIVIYLRQSIENKVFTTVFASTTALHLRSKCELHNLHTTVEPHIENGILTTNITY